MREMVNKDTLALSSYTTKISTSLSGVSSPRAYEPKIQAFNTGWVLKYSRMVSIISVLIIVFFCKGKNTFFIYTTREDAKICFSTAFPGVSHPYNLSFQQFFNR